MGLAHSVSFFGIHFLLTVGLQGECLIISEWGTELQTRFYGFG